ncbi:hypothetical protein KOR42_06130 [Thalassoglobus neptunius]|uniref:Phage XkdN-like protein n=1 Tax=Thalassoglobus neptunius TaxID=1938619 RepID=A0A5C5X4X5_9PLAN|nr:hypothetical protein [Thalassoglobus neptunius]TWT57255.1 hypothetical protein KOR42_06130 [Thalassoglobus neptunius]
MPNYLNRDNKNQFAKSKIKEYPLPFDPGTLVRVKQQSISRMHRYSEASQAGGTRAKKETFSLIADSIVDETDQPVWESGEVAQLAEADCQLVNALIKMIGHANGGTEDEIEEMVGNFNETE